LDKASEAEAFGALAVGRQRHRRQAGSGNSPVTSAQKRAIRELTRSLVKFARSVGAANKIIKLGDFSLEFHRKGSKEVLSISRAASS
jgi:hypothetical protein